MEEPGRARQQAAGFQTVQDRIQRSGAHLVAVPLQFFDQPQAIHRAFSGVVHVEREKAMAGDKRLCQEGNDSPPAADIFDSRKKNRPKRAKQVQAAARGWQCPCVWNWQYLSGALKSFLRKMLNPLQRKTGWMEVLMKSRVPCSRTRTGDL